MIVVKLVEIIPIRSWINEEEMRVNKGFHKTGKELYMLYVMCEYPEWRVKIIICEYKIYDNLWGKVLW